MGFPSPAQSDIKNRVSLDKACIPHPASTSLVRMEEACLAAGIFPGAILVVDAALKPAHGSIVLAAVEGAYVIRRLRLYPVPALESLGTRGEKRLIDPEQEGVAVFGVVTYAVNSLQGRDGDDTPCL
ncbi:S24 family peptidase [Martelella alba]|uniref:LexA family transcriptional regulator n=1 Tax=Martelella alba TaxID=2590451 RepID=A0ABY2SQI2_9HYPH|nr:S24 family peptidase [Martelella alba]TKI08328.1 LexA family transcriptional regulator [Martelella alba]